MKLTNKIFRNSIFFTLTIISHNIFAMESKESCNTLSLEMTGGNPNIGTTFPNNNSGEEQEFGSKREEKEKEKRPIEASFVIVGNSGTLENNIGNSFVLVSADYSDPHCQDQFSLKI